MATGPQRGRRRVEVIGVAFNSAGTTDGVSRAPAVLREAGLVDDLRASGLEVHDRGDVQLGPTAPMRDAASGVIEPHALAAMIRSVADEVDGVIRGGAFPLVLGGDCPVLLGCLAAPGLEAPGLLFVDGHEDAWPPARSTTGEAADMELGFALGWTIDRLPEPLVAVLPRLHPGRVIVVGARDKAELEAAGVPSIDDRIEVIRPEAIDPAEPATEPASTAATAARSLGAASMARLASAGRVWFHVDLDVLATADLGAVDYRQPGGLEWSTLTALSRGALAESAVAGWDVTIYNPDLDPTRDGARRIVRYLVDSLRD